MKSQKMFFKVLTTSFVLLTLSKANRNLSEVFVWKVLNFGKQPNNDNKDSSIFTQTTGMPVDVDVQYTINGSMRVFTTIPRSEADIPFTLATISKETGPDGPIIYPYPSYDWNNSDNCTGITSVFRVAIDKCDHMWVMDTGIIAGKQICPPQLLTFDLHTDELINRFQFPSDLYTPNDAMFITPAIDTRDHPPIGQCKKVMVYIADVTNHGLVVYDSHTNSAWRIENELMYPDPDWQTFSVAGEKFNLMFGIFSVSLKPRTIGSVDNTCERHLYFHALSSNTENSVPLCLIDNQTIWQNNREAMPNAFQTLGSNGFQLSMETIDSNGNLFAGTYDPLKIFTWNISTPYTADRFKTVADNPKQLQVTSGMKVIKNPLGEEELWVLTCKFQEYVTGTLDPKDSNFRIMTCKIDDLLNGRGCSRPVHRISRRSVPFHECNVESCRKG